MPGISQRRREVQQKTLLQLLSFRQVKYGESPMLTHVFELPVE